MIEYRADIGVEVSACEYHAILHNAISEQTEVMGRKWYSGLGSVFLAGLYGVSAGALTIIIALVFLSNLARSMGVDPSGLQGGLIGILSAMSGLTVGGYLYLAVYSVLE